MNRTDTNVCNGTEDPFYMNNQTTHKVKPVYTRNYPRNSEISHFMASFMQMEHEGDGLYLHYTGYFKSPNS